MRNYFCYFELFVLAIPSVVNLVANWAEFLQPSVITVIALYVYRILCLWLCARNAEGLF